MTERDHLIDLHLQALKVLGWSLPTAAGDALDDLCNGCFLTTSQSATICEVSDQAIRDWIEHADSVGKPIGVKRATWMISRSRLFAYIEEHHGLPDRVKAERRFEELWPKWSAPQELRIGAKEHATG
jgi:hypothetical protein